MNKAELEEENKYLSSRVASLLDEIWELKDAGDEPRAEDYLSLVLEVAYMASITLEDFNARAGMERICEICNQFLELED